MSQTRRQRVLGAGNRGSPTVPIRVIRSLVSVVSRCTMSASPRRSGRSGYCAPWLSEMMRMPVTISGSMAITVSMAIFTYGCSSCS